jgi:acyl-coenzyme A thioesterase PaaI-like protein
VQAIQDQLFPDTTCFGCGPANLKGLGLKSYPGPDGLVVASFQAWPEHDNGLGYLNGGIIGTLLDCHSAAAIMLEADRRGWLPGGPGQMAYVTAGMDVRYLRPSPLHEPAQLHGSIEQADHGAITAHVELLWQDKVRASATVLWKRWRPR